MSFLETIYFNIRFYFLICISSACLISCQPSEFDSAEALNNFISDPENDYSKLIKVNGFQITVTFRPTDLLVYQEADDNILERTVLDSLRKKYDQYYYFQLSLSKNNKEALYQSESGEQYSDLVQTLSYRMEDYTSLTSGNDTIPLVDFALNRTYGLNQSTDLLLVFDKQRALDKEWVQFNLNEFGLGVGNQSVRFRKKELDRAPKINFNK